MTILTCYTRGYMKCRAERSLYLNIGGKHMRWGKFKPGKVRYWCSSPRGKTSSMVFADGTNLAVDLTGASGADIMLVTTADAEGRKIRLGDRQLVFFFPTTSVPPSIRIEGNTIVIGRQRVSFEQGHIVFAIKGE